MSKLLIRHLINESERDRDRIIKYFRGVSCRFFQVERHKNYFNCLIRKYIIMFWYLERGNATCQHSEVNIYVLILSHSEAKWKQALTLITYWCKFVCQSYDKRYTLIKSIPTTKPTPWRPRQQSGPSHECKPMSACEGNLTYTSHSPPAQQYLP